MAGIYKHAEPGRSALIRVLHIRVSRTRYVRHLRSSRRVAGRPHGSDYSPVTASNPAKKNEVIIIYATGLGSLISGQPKDGEPATGPATGRVFHGVSIGTVLYAGLTPGYVGLYQLNVRVARSVRPATWILPHQPLRQLDWRAAPESRSEQHREICRCSNRHHSRRVGRKRPKFNVERLKRRVLNPPAPRTPQ